LQKIHCGLILQNISIEWPIFDNIFLKNDRLNKLKKMLLKKNPISAGKWPNRRNAAQNRKGF